MLKKFLKAINIRPFGAPGIVISDEGTCTSARALQAFMEEYGTQ